MAFFLGALLFPSSALATVIEWDVNGKPIVQSKSPQKNIRSSTSMSSQKFSNPPTENTNPDLERALNQRLTRELALEFSGHDGVVAAGLTALEFIDLFEALIEQESAFNHRAVSEKGAQGLGQLMPETAAELQVQDPFDPYENLNASATYFTLLLGKFKRTDLALAAYNAGPTRVKELGQIPRIVETQNYVRAVLRQAGQPVPDFPAIQQASKQHSEPQDGSKLLETSSKAKAGVPLTGDVSVWEF
ncbi:lytic transglycosylase domain-containing protein [Roseibium sp.]|uniref:lytic transglycosylase domain-containing protein n=1 Tax=Roseibium sp. TaxID=1936156 RepID=UPI003B50E134